MMTITLPKGYELPEGAKPGEPFDAVASILLNEDGTFSLSAIDGMELEAEEAEMEDEEATDPMTAFAQQVKMPWSNEDEDD